MAYVYQHTRLDTNEVFYVGIGKTKLRAYSKFSRSEHWHNIVNKAGYYVSIIAEGIDFKEALDLEIQLIKKIGRNDLGLGPLVNKTDGGEGTSGPKSEDHKKKISDAKKGKKPSEETRRKMSESRMASKRSPYSVEARKNISEAKKGKPRKEETKKKISESLKGRKTHPCSEETRKKISEAKKGIIFSEEVRKRMSEGKKGKKLSEETRRKISEARKGKKFDKSKYV